MCEILNKIKNKTAEELLSSYYPSAKIPVDIVELAQNIGISLSGVNFTKMEQSDIFKDRVNERGNILGAVYIKDEDVKISYSTVLQDKNNFNNLSEVDKAEILKRRQRFTIAHEIAHCCYDMSGNSGSHVEFRTEEADYNSPKERRANILAGELLIPTQVIMAISELLNYNLSLSSMSNIFSVSKKVVKARIEYLKETNILPLSTKILD